MLGALLAEAAEVTPAVELALLLAPSGHRVSGGVLRHRVAGPMDRGHGGPRCEPAPS